MTDANYLRLLPKAIIVDLDGTMATIHGRGPYDAANCASDLPNWPVIECVRAMHAAGHAIVFVSGRQEKDRLPSTQWLDRYLHKLGPGGVTIPYVLHMRPTGDQRPDNVVKTEIYDAHIKGRYGVMFVLDDRRRVVNAWRNDLGLTCFQVNPGPSEKDDCPHCAGTGVSRALEGPEKEAANELAKLTSLPSWEPHQDQSDRTIKAIVKAVSRARAR